MRRSTFPIVLSFIASTLLLGCAGYTGPKTSTITGVVLDADGFQVTDARVWTVDSETRTSPSGAFVIENNRPGTLRVRASIFRDGVEYRGENTALNFENEQTQSITIVVGATTRAARITGTVRDRNGFVLENASVHAFNEIGGSIRAFTNSQGKFDLPYLLPDVLYTISATGATYRSDQEDVILNAREQRKMNFVLGNPGLPDLIPPQNFYVQTWVSPTDPTRGPARLDRYALAREKYGRGELANPEIATSGTRSPLRTDIIVEADLYWDWVVDPDYLGYAIYRANGNVSVVDFLYFSPDPMSGSFTDIGLNPGSTYTYGATSLATLFPDYEDTESDLSDLYVVDTLDKLILRSVGVFPLTFQWYSSFGSEEYAIYVFDEFPGVSVGSVWDSFASTILGTSYVYDGPSLEPGRTYYYYVVGIANGFDSITISQVDSFIAP